MNIKEAAALEDIPDLLVFMHMPVQDNIEHHTRARAQPRNFMNALGEEYFERLLVDITESFLGDGHSLYGLVVTFMGDGIDFGIVACRGGGDGDVPEKDADGSERGVAGGHTRVMGESLVAGEFVKVVSAHVGWCRVDGVRRGDCKQVSSGC